MIATTYKVWNLSELNVKNGQIPGVANRQHPRILLSSAATVMALAAQKGVISIDAVFVTSATEAVKTQSTPDFSDGIKDAI